MIMSNITSKFLPSHQPLLSNLLFVMLLSFTLSNYALADSTQQQADKTQQQIDNLNQKIEHLEHQKDNLDTQTDLLNKQLEMIEADLQNSFTAKSLEIDKKNLEIEKHFKTSWAVIFFGILGGVAGLFAIFFSLRKYIENQAMQMASKKVTEDISELIEVNKNQLEQLIDTHNLEKKLRKEKHILAIVETEQDKKGLEDFFKDVGIDRVSYRVNEPYSPPEPHIDLVLFRDTRDKNNYQEIHDFFKKYIENSARDNLLFIYYGSNQLDYSKEYVNFANSKFTLYNQIINSLTYQYLRQKNASV